MKRAASIAAALLCLVVAAVLALAAIDVTRWQDVARTDDVGYRVEPDASTWDARPILPFGAARALLGTADDLAFRRAMRAVRLGRPDQPPGFDPAYVAMRNDAATRLNAIVKGRDDAERRSDAANLLGVLAFSDASYAFEDKAGLFAAAADRFRQAIVLDSGNDDAKYNLELTLSRQSQLELSESAGGNNPSPGGKGARGAGTGTAGSGY